MKAKSVCSVNLKKVNTPQLIKGLLQGEFITPTKSEISNIQEFIQSSIEDGKYIIARNALVIGIFFDSERTFSFIKNKGLFRYSNYISKKCILKELASEILLISDISDRISTLNKKYFNSIINLSVFLSCYKEHSLVIQKEIKSFQNNYKNKSLIKTLLAYVEYLFFSNYISEPVTDKFDIRQKTKEEISASVSYLIYTIIHKGGHKGIDSEYISDDYILNGFIKDLIIPACLILDLKEFEIKIERFNYECLKTDNEFHIIPPNRDFEKSISLGYIKNELQEYNDFDEKIDAISLHELVDELVKKKNFDVFHYTNSFNCPRFIMAGLEPVFDIIFENFIKPERLYKEEIQYLFYLFKEQLLDYTKLSSISIRDNFTILDFLKCKRIFVFLYLLFVKEWRNSGISNNSVLLSSLIPCFTLDSFYYIFEKIIPKDKIDSFFDIIRWSPDSDILFDLQYQPILFLNNKLMIPISILVLSNSVRNLFALEYKRGNCRLFPDGKDDAVVDRLNFSFSKAGVQSYKQTAVLGTEIDLFAIYEDTLFVFECKQSILPTSVYDLRTTYDYILKAEKQLDYLILKFNEGKLIEALERKHKIKLENIKRVVSSIVLSNRLFNGDTFKYPVRYLYEIDNILNEGTIRTEYGTFYLWDKKRLSLNDLLNYFSQNNKLMKCLYDSMSARSLRYNKTPPYIVSESYYIDINYTNTRLKEFVLTLRKKE